MGDQVTGQPAAVAVAGPASAGWRATLGVFRRAGPARAASRPARRRCRRPDVPSRGAVAAGDSHLVTAQHVHLLDGLVDQQRLAGPARHQLGGHLVEQDPFLCRAARRRPAYRVGVAGRPPRRRAGPARLPRRRRRPGRAATGQPFAQLPAQLADHGESHPRSGGGWAWRRRAGCGAGRSPGGSGGRLGGPGLAETRNRIRHPLRRGRPGQPGPPLLQQSRTGPTRPPRAAAAVRRWSVLLKRLRGTRASSGTRATTRLNASPLASPCPSPTTSSRHAGGTRRSVGSRSIARIIYWVPERPGSCAGTDQQHLGRRQQRPGRP